MKKIAIILLISFLSGCSSFINAPPDEKVWHDISADLTCSENHMFVYLDTAASSSFLISMIPSLIIGDIASAAFNFIIAAPIGYSAYKGAQKSAKCSEFKSFKKAQRRINSEANNHKSLKQKLLELHQLRDSGLITNEEFLQQRQRVLNIDEKPS